VIQWWNIPREPYLISALRNKEAGSTAQSKGQRRRSLKHARSRAEGGKSDDSEQFYGCWEQLNWAKTMQCFFWVFTYLPSSCYTIVHLTKMQLHRHFEETGANARNGLLMRTAEMCKYIGLWSFTITGWECSPPYVRVHVRVRQAVGLARNMYWQNDFEFVELPESAFVYFHPLALSAKSGVEAGHWSAHSCAPNWPTSVNTTNLRRQIT
jgi:hypothetical protein